MYEVLVIGCGPSGMMAAIKAAERYDKVVILEHKSKPGLKLLATGGGKCNLTNTLDNDQFIEDFGRNGKFMSDALRKLDSNALREFFDELNVPTDTMDGKHIFPTSRRAKTILDALIRRLKALDVKILTSITIKDIKKVDEQFILESSQGILESRKIILATGGKSYPELGSDGSGYKLAEMFGHTIIPLSPTSVPLVTEEKWVKDFKSETLGNVIISAKLKKNKTISIQGDLTFTDNGIAGSSILRISREISDLLIESGRVPLKISLYGKFTENEWNEYFKLGLKKEPQISILEFVGRKITKKFADKILKESGITANKIINQINKNEKAKLIKAVTEFELTAIGTAGFAKAVATRGGVSLKEINPKTMESKLTDGLYFAGEVMELEGPCGGYNLQWAFSSGNLAGENV